jgi:hypothetical protein
VSTEGDDRELDEEGRPPMTGSTIIRDLERTLGLGVIVQSIDAGPTFVIRAHLMLGPHSEAVAGTGPTEAEAWRDLARAAIAWRTTNDKHIPWWGGGG